MYAQAATLVLDSSRLIPVLRSVTAELSPTVLDEEFLGLVSNALEQIVINLIK